MKALLAISLLLTLAGCARKEEATPPVQAAAEPAVTPLQEFEAWRDNRAERLRKDDSWLTLVGLHWLEEGRNRFGSDRSNDIVMTKKAPARAGTIVVNKGKVRLEADPKASLTIDGSPVTAPVELLADVDEKGPTMIASGPLRLYVIKRDDKFAIRVKDTQSEALTTFKGLEYFPYDPKWRFEARWEPYVPPRKVPITNIVGQTSDEQSPGAIVFSVDGNEYRIDPLLEGTDDLFLIFKDETAEKETYGAGRYLYTKVPKPGEPVIVDFNKAYNPPCVFTPFATCPLPPPQNKLPIRIEAGEKVFKGKSA